MKILIVSYFFPPFNQVGAVRVGKYAKYLRRMGHDVRVLACEPLPLPSNLQVEIESERVERSKWLDVNWPVTMLLGRQRVQSRGFEMTAGSSGGLPHLLRKLYRDLIHFPDAQVGWFPYAIQQGRRMCDGWCPDVIYSSALPVTSLFVAERLARHLKVPWIAEFRDLWADNHNRDVPGWRKKLERRLEQRLLRHVAGLVTVSEPLAETLRGHYPDKPVLMLPNGFDREDYEQPFAADNLLASDQLNVLYTGMLYPGRYDLATFFSSLARLDTPHCAVHFFGRYINLAAKEAEQAGVAAQVNCNEPVSYTRSVALQRSADILLMFLWNDPNQKGVYTGKLFEYLAARRPILAIGHKDSAPARLIVERGAGLVSDDVVEIAAWLKQQWQLKSSTGTIPVLTADVARGFGREEQVEQLCSFIIDCIETVQSREEMQ
ncbi:glycosyltransferase family 4 protein [Mariprofundus erugo]|uniref:glycosyltransferase n=1 Tax=Mariprofundus erugo TaxID=2528639 RepID=UPI0010FEA0B4|nr:glycosyltransferase [Mariprofundus erugo]TLS76034.1 glycosyltransferase family 4 protein [Mariprofundus erugo]